VEQMQHQTLPDAPKTNEGIPNWDLLVILCGRWCRPSPNNTPNVKGLGVVLPPLKGKQTSTECRFICQLPIWSKAGMINYFFSPTSIYTP